MKKSKIFLTLASAVLLVAASVMGTLAYLTSTQEVKNTFTVGQVKITLDEAKVGDDGKVLTGENAQRVAENSYHLLPGHKYDKDPTITVLSGSDEAYVRMLVTVTFGKKLEDSTLATSLDNIFTGYNKKNWNRVEKVVTSENNEQHTVITYEYRYNTTVEGKVEDSSDENKMVDGDNKLPALFTGISVPSEWGNDMMEAIGGFPIDVVGQAIQADGFDNADAAWQAFNNQKNPTSTETTPSTEA